MGNEKWETREWGNGMATGESEAIVTGTVTGSVHVVQSS